MPDEAGFQSEQSEQSEKSEKSEQSEQSELQSKLKFLIQGSSVNNYLLPFWDSDLSIDLPSSFPFGKDYAPVWSNAVYNDGLGIIAKSCIECGSELFFMVSPLTGCIGSFTRENAFSFSQSLSLDLGFMLLLGYSHVMERIVFLALDVFDENHELKAGITNCHITKRGVFSGRTRAIAIASLEPFFDPGKFLLDFALLLREISSVNNSGRALAFFAEKFGYTRFAFDWEIDSPEQLRIRKALYELKFDSTRDVTGPSPAIQFPPFLGTVLNVD